MKTTHNPMTPKSMIVNSMGMVEIPTKLRKKYNLHEGSEIAFVEFEGGISLIPILDLEKLRLLLPSRKQMEQIYEEAQEKELQLELED